jgi:ribosomal protein S1
LKELEVGKVFDGVVSGVSSYGLFVTIGGTVE